MMKIKSYSEIETRPGQDHRLCGFDTEITDDEYESIIRSYEDREEIVFHGKRGIVEELVIQKTKDHIGIFFGLEKS